MLVQIKKKAPLVHCMTNYVVANFTANGLLAVGASPIMADEVKEVSEIVSIAQALLINIGTVNDRTAEAMLLAGKENIREVIAFPKNGKATDPLTSAPSLVSEAQLDELSIHTTKIED